MKKPLTYRQQAKRLKRKYKLIIDDFDVTEEILSTVNYYKLFGYGLKLLDDKSGRFLPNTNFYKIYDIYKFDNDLKIICLKAIQLIELQLRSQLAFEFSIKRGAEGYINIENFNYKFKKQINNKQIERFQNLQKNIYSRLNIFKNKKFIKHHLIKYNGHFPVWVIVEVLTLGDLINFYKLFKKPEKRSVAKKYYHSRVSNLLSRMDAITEIRNICSHFSRLYDANLSKTPHMLSKEKKICKDNTCLYARLLAMKWFFENNINFNKWNNIVIELKKIIESNSAINLKLIDFPKNWYKNLLIKK